MEQVKLKELKDDAIINVKVNKTYYQMCKAALFLSFKELNDHSKDSENFIKSIVSKDYKDMTDKERTFYTLTLLVGEIEKQAQQENLFNEKEMSKEDLEKQISQKILKSNED